MKRAPRSLIANEGYELNWTRWDRRFFNQPMPRGPNGVPAPIPGQSPTAEWPWVSRGYPIVIPGNVNTGVPLLLADDYRNLLIFQNNSVATAPDIAPNLFISVDGPVQTVVIGVNTFTFNAITLVPGEGLVLDTRVLNNQIFVAWGAATNGGGTEFTIGMCMYGRTANSPPEGPGSAQGGPMRPSDLSRIRWGEVSPQLANPDGRFYPTSR